MVISPEKHSHLSMYKEAANYAEKRVVRAYLFFLLILISLPLLGEEDRCKDFPSMDYTNLWPVDSIRQQCNTGACHSFATTSLVEALYKKYLGSYIDLSERDLFAQHFGASDEKEAQRLVRQHLDMAKRAGRDLGHWVDRLEKQEKLNGWTATQTLEYYANQYELYQGGGYVDQDFNLLRQEGICYERELPFSWFSGQEQGQNALSCLRQARFDVIKFVGECKVDDTYSINKVDEFCQNVEKILEDKSIYAGLITEASKLCLKQRKEVKSFVRSLSLKKKSPKGSTDKTRNELHRYLSCQPLAMDVKGYSEILNGADRPGHGLHAVALAGYDCKTDEYIIRNSWGAAGYDRVPAQKILEALDTYYVFHKGKSRDCSTSR
jgi:hypothetical protein